MEAALVIFSILNVLSRACKCENFYNDPLLVKTKSGWVRGYSKVTLNHEVHVFEGVPFAKPPLGPLRFRKPVPVEPWDGVLNATKLPNSCYQESYDYFPGFKGEQMWNANTPLSEDCLYISLYVPTKFSIRHRGDDHKKFKTPVFIWIYGGGYISGTSTLEVYTSDIMAVYNNAIVVSMQYRVGAFGFLFLSPSMPVGNNDAPGNMGLWDQAMAIKWVKDNIAAFGGDPDLITLFGESAGAGSVSALLISPATKGLATRGILQSGTLNAPWSIMAADKAVQIGLALVEDCGCDSSQILENPSRVMACMRSVDAKDISKKQWNSYWGILGFPSAPTIDGVFITKDPMEMLRDGEFSDVEVIIGSNLNEGTYFLLYDFIDYFERDKSTALTRKKFLDIIDTIFKEMTPFEREAIAFHYTDWNNPTDGYEMQNILGHIVGDYFFICPTNIFATEFADRGADVYYYFFTQRTDSNPWAKWMGVCHGDEIAYVFGQPLNVTEPYNARERDLSIRMMQAFSRFALAGKPTEDEKDWPKYSKHRPIYYLYDAVNFGTGRGPRLRECEFWNGFMPQIEFYAENNLRECGFKDARLELNSTTKHSSSAHRMRVETTFICAIASQMLSLKVFRAD